MKKLTLIFSAIAVSFHLTAQISEGGLPLSYKNGEVKSISEIATYRLPSMDTSALAGSDPYKQLPLRYAVLEEVDTDLKRSAKRTLLPDGGTLWQYRISSPEGKSLQVIFRKYLVPEGARLWIYDDKYEVIRGAYSTINMTTDLMFVTGDFPGDHVIIEYYEPAGIMFEGEIIIGWVGQAFIDILGLKSGNTDALGFIAVNCEEGIQYQNQKHSVCKYSFNDGQFSYLCSGALINNTRNDGTPYFLTAFHCINSESKAATIVAYFNFEEASCTDISLYASQTLSGSLLRTTGGLSDYTLLEFNDVVPSSYQPFFAGWDAGENTPLFSSCIHHPNGRTKKISLDNDPAGTNEENLSWEEGSSSPAGSHWAVLFDEGITASGSSGSPLFDENKRIRGQLHGGNIIDFYGKLSYSWNQPGSLYPPLRTFLDPISSGVTMVDGYYPSTNLPDAQFLSRFSAVCVDSPIEITGFSAFEPLNWEWSFRPARAVYHNGTDASSQSPVISFMMAGTYNVSLKVFNSAGSDLMTIENYITAGTNLSLKAIPSGTQDSCLSTFSQLSLQAYGADAYQWTLKDNSDDLFYIVNNSANPAEIRVLDGVQITQSTNLEITLTGSQGSCQSTIGISIPLEAQTNDNIANAIEIATGTNGPFTNSCATIEEGEPVPPFSSCTGQLSWCDEYGTGENIVEKSIWFTYVPEANRTVTIYSVGFDNQIAVYKAGSAADIVSGNYSLLAANDDYTESDFNPRITSLDVEANQKYWIQVDGSAGGTTGAFNLVIGVLSSIEETGPAGEKIKVYPQPADAVVTFESSAFTRCSMISVELFDSAGRIVCQDSFTESSGTISLALGDMPAGIYFARIYCDKEVTVVKVVV